MARNVIVDAGFLVALLAKHDSQHDWAATQAHQFSLPWRTTEAVVSEAFYLLGRRGMPSLAELLRRRALLVDFVLEDQLESILRLMQKYRDVPMSLADACLVRLSEILPDPIILTVDSDFRIYRRHGRQTVPSVLPG
jgi:predicted nucleic acid-binding protein